MDAGRRVAMCTITSSTDTLYWLISDHLSSTTIVTNESGTIVSEMKYSAFGEIRDINGSSPTDYLYTGQRKEVEFGLSYYVARWYDISTGHFTSADSFSLTSRINPPRSRPANSRAAKPRLIYPLTEDPANKPPPGVRPGVRPCARARTSRGQTRGQTRGRSVRLCVGLVPAIE